MQDKGSEASPSTVTAQAIFGIAQGSKVVLSRTMSDFIFNMLASKVPAVASALGAIDQQTATIATANDDMVRIVPDKSVTLPASGGNPAVTFDSVTVSLSRSDQGLFDFGITATTSTPGAQPLDYSEKGLTARQDSGNYVFSKGTDPHLRIRPASGPDGVATIEGYTAPYLQGQPNVVCAMAPTTVGLINLRRLPDASWSSSQARSSLYMAYTRSCGGETGTH